MKRLLTAPPKLPAAKDTGDPGAPGDLDDGNFAVTYDPGGRVTTWQRDDNHSPSGFGGQQSWNYDDAGNWASTDIGNSTQSREHDNSDQLTKIGGNNLQYTLTGCLTHDHHGNQYSWDIDNRLSAKTHDSQALGTADYQYDVLGRRVAKDSGGGSAGKTVTLWWNMREVADYETTGTTPGPIHHYLNLTRHNDRLARTVQVGSQEKIQYYHKNYLDHVYAITDEDGKALEYIRYSAFGIATFYDFTGLKVANSPTGNQFTWNAKRLDPHLGWYVYHYRHYSPELGRWPSRDPIGEDGGLNVYAFVGNGPTAFIDLLGMFIVGPTQIPELPSKEQLEWEQKRKERLRPNPFIQNVDYFPAITEARLEEALEAVDQEGRTTDECDEQLLRAVRESKKQVIRAALEWNETSPRWSQEARIPLSWLGYKGNECSRQASRFSDYASNPSFPSCHPGIDKSSLGAPFWMLPSRKSGMNPANREACQRHTVNLVQALQSKKCCFEDFVIDVFKWKRDSRDWDPAIRFGPLAEWNEHFPEPDPDHVD